MGWFANLLSNKEDPTRYIVERLEDDLDTFMLETSCANNALAKRLVDQTGDLIAQIDSITGTVGGLVDQLETESTDEYGYSGWWPVNVNVLSEE